MRNKNNKTTTIRISGRAHDKLRELAYNKNENIVDIIDGFCGTRANHHMPNEKPDTRKKHIRIKPLSMVEKLLLEQKKKK